MRHYLPSLLVAALITGFAPAAQTGPRIVYPQVAVGPIAGQEFKIELRLGNRNSGQPWSGMVHLLRQSDLAIMSGLNVAGPSGLPQTQNGSWALQIEPEGSILYRISSPTLQIGVLVIQSEQSPVEDLVASFFYQLHDEATRSITDLIAVQPSRDPALSYSAMISKTRGFNVGLAIAAESGIDAALASSHPLPAVDIGFQLWLDGQLFAAVATLGGEEAGQKAFFPGEIMSGLPASFETARLHLTASQPIYVTLLGVGSPPVYQDVQIGPAPAQVHSGDDGETFDLSSSWILAITPTSSTCGVPVGETARENILIADCGQQLSIITFNGLWGRGVTQGAHMIFTGAEANSTDFGCPVTLVSGGAGSVSEERIEGRFTTTVSFDPASCGNVPDCNITNQFRMTKTYEEAFACFDRAIFQDPADAAYILPYPIGASYKLSQSYCGGLGGGHRNQLAYDFMMPVGDPVIAARDGIVRYIQADYPDDGQGSDHNNVQIEHGDGSVAFYAHLKQFSILVAIGERVQAGQQIALAGHSGTPDVPHLHFGVYQDFPPVEGVDLPITFRNVAGAKDCRGGLVIGETYQAQ